MKTMQKLGPLEYTQSYNLPMALDVIQALTPSIDSVT